MFQCQAEEQEPSGTCKSSQDHMVICFDFETKRSHTRHPSCLPALLPLTSPHPTQPHHSMATAEDATKVAAASVEAEAQYYGDEYEPKYEQNYGKDEYYPEPKKVLLC